MNRLNLLTRFRDSVFLAYKDVSGHLLSQNPNLRRLDCMNPAVALGNLVTNPQTYYRDVGTDDLTDAWQDVTGIKRDFVPTMGVRDSLLGIFDVLGRERSTQNTRKVFRPENIYPVYNQIARLTGVDTRQYTTYPQFDLDTLLSKADGEDDVVLLTNPIVPNGVSMRTDKQDKAKLLNWLNGSKHRILVIDAVYTYDYEDTTFTDLLDTDQVFICHSMSKSYLLPLRFGATYVPDPYKRLLADRTQLADQHGLNEAFHRLTTFPDLPRAQSDIFNAEWLRLRPFLRSIDPDWMRPLSSYFSRVPVDFMDLHDHHHVLAISPMVFHSQDLSTVITCLHDIKPKPMPQTMYHVTVLSNLAKAYDKYGQTYDKTHIEQSTYPDKFFLLNRSELEIGKEKAGGLLAKLGIPGDKLLVMRTRVLDQLYPNERTGLGQSINSTKITVDGLEIDGKPVTVEEAMAMSLKLSEGSLGDFKDLVPRSVSLLPVAQGCQAKCPFCFSHASISDDERQKPLSDDVVEQVLRVSRERGAERAVITGGGEPTMLPHPRMMKLIRQCSRYFPKVVMITNGYQLGHMDDESRRATMLQYQNAGLSVLSVSRHGTDPKNNAKIMYLDTQSDLAAKTLREHKKDFKNLKLRWVCVLQKGGVQDMKTLKEYLDWVVLTGMTEVCFKELYVSTSHESVYHDNQSNKWSREHQIPLKLVLDFVEKQGGKKISELPWGSPIYRVSWQGRELDIAAYTEPSVFWERKHKMIRSWNLLAEGTCYASLEDKSSVIEL